MHPPPTRSVECLHVRLNAYRKAEGARSAGVVRFHERIRIDGTVLGANGVKPNQFRRSSLVEPSLIASEGWRK